MKVVFLFVALCFLNSCQVAKDVSRVSGGYIDKSILKGEWYYGSSIVDKQYHNASQFIGASCGADRIKFELSENMLYAYRSYERTPGTESGNAGSQSMIAAFAVISHFDIRRDYNDVNGVESNLIIENTSDQPWFKRKYVRVDWSKNFAPDTDCNDWFKTQGFAQIQRETHAREPYRVRTSEDYIETTQEALIQPQQAACAAIGEWNCLPSRAKMKLSFKKIKPTNYVPKIYPDTVPLEYGHKDKELCFKGDAGCEDLQALWMYSGPGGTEICNPTIHNIDECTQYKIPVFAKFGYFRTERYHFDREQGFTLSGRTQLINRWNIWEDVDKKIPKPIVYYVNVSFPEDLFEASQELARDWSSAFLQTVAKLKNTTPEEVLKLYGELFQIRRNSCNLEHINQYVSEFSLSDYLKDNGLTKINTANLEEACAALEWAGITQNLPKSFQWEQLGDIRYNMLNYTPKAELAGPLGYGPTLTDPVTGEIIHGAANIYGASLDTYAAMGADIVQQINHQDVIKYNSDVSNKTALSFEKLVKIRTKNLRDKDYFVKLPEHSVSNWELLKNLGLEERYLLKEVKPSEWGNKNSPLEQKIDFLGQRNACYLAEMIEPHVADLAAQLHDKSWLEAYQLIRAAVFKGVAAHELGHTFGLRHNFAGSYDALNYFEDFWKDGVKRKSEIRYSSIMDYMQRFNSDFSGIGLYDRAAIQFGYGDLVEVFDESNSAFVPRSWNGNINLFNYKDLPYLYAGNGLDEKLKTHYQAVKADYDKGLDVKIDVKSLPDIKPNPSNMYRRKTVTFDQYYQNLAKRMFGKKAPDNLYEVPYMYCSDAYAYGGGLTCNRWDMGASAEEIVDNAAELYDSYYWFNSFRRDRVNITPGSYMARLYDRTYQPMLNPFKYLYHYQRTSLSIWPLVQDWSLAAYKGLNFFGKVLQSVEPGHYCLTADNFYVPQDQATDCSNSIDIGMDQGRYYDTHYTQNFFYKANNVGHMYDKLLAMHALTDSKAYFMRDFSDQFNRGAFSIGYYRVFAPEMIKLFTDIMLDKDFEYSPYVLVNQDKAQIQYRSLVNMGSEKIAADMPRIKASNSWIMRHYALLLPALNFSSPVDGQLDYIKRARITLVGSENDPVIQSETAQQIIFEDPQSKKQYRSMLIDSKELSPGYLILEEAQKYSAEADPLHKERGLYERVNFIELLRMLGDALESGG
ncbi:MAG: zinc-dependent metalloprotease [Myxococcaceae bacterium]